MKSGDRDMQIILVYKVLLQPVTSDGQTILEVHIVSLSIFLATHLKVEIQAT